MDMPDAFRFALSPIKDSIKKLSDIEMLSLTYSLQSLKDSIICHRIDTNPFVLP